MTLFLGTKQTLQEKTVGFLQWEIIKNVGFFGIIFQHLNLDKLQYLYIHFVPIKIIVYG
jgi:hypothetical protein